MPTNAPSTIGNTSENLNNLRFGNKYLNLNELLGKKILVTTKFIDQGKTERISSLTYLGELVGLDSKFKFIILKDVEIFLVENFKPKEKIGNSKLISLNLGIVSSIEVVGDGKG
ncbi:hypothetical protein DRN69_03885 [Candidatus Pacearchaeota archaeon]|nr:MAG: hypothetical protein DRN69_03885 [Candidatus Pacearchaeota archaeon]